MNVSGKGKDCTEIRAGEHPAGERKVCFKKVNEKLSARARIGVAGAADTDVAS